MPQPPDQNCGNCHFLIDTYKDEIPRCHRYPPQAKEETWQPEGVISTMTATFWRVPEVEKDHWCGEWRQILENGNISAYSEEE